jgi:hypothetical protein
VPVTRAWDVLLALEPQPASPPLARHALVSQGLGEDLEHAVGLLSTELVANAVRHAGLNPDARIVLRARLQRDFARVEVADPGAGFDPTTVVSGTGLRLLGELATRWDVHCSERGCTVWFEVGRPRGVRTKVQSAALARREALRQRASAAAMSAAIRDLLKGGRATRVEKRRGRGKDGG